jgi:MFS family permease
MFTTAFATLVAGRRVESTGRYRVWPIVGAACALAGVLLLAQLDADTPAATAAALGAVLGTGIGCIMQTSLLALQNGVQYRDMGVATSTALLARTLGVTLGTALASAVLQAGLPATGTPSALDYAAALPDVYLAMVPIALVTLVLALRLPEHPLREHTRFDAVDDASAGAASAGLVLPPEP